MREPSGHVAELAPPHLHAELGLAGAGLAGHLRVVPLAQPAPEQLLVQAARSQSRTHISDAPVPMCFVSLPPCAPGSDTTGAAVMRHSMSGLAAV